MPIEWLKAFVEFLAGRRRTREDYREDFKTAIEVYRKLNEDITRRFAELEKENERLKSLQEANGNLTRADTEHESYLINKLMELIQERRDQEEHIIFEARLDKTKNGE